MGVTMLNTWHSEIKVVNQRFKQWGTMCLRQYFFRNSVFCLHFHDLNDSLGFLYFLRQKII